MHWINIKDKLPTEADRYLVYQVWPYGSTISIASWTPKYDGFEEHLTDRAIWYRWDSEYGDYEVRDITHWMPLPEEPR